MDIVRELLSMTFSNKPETFQRAAREITALRAENERQAKQIEELGPFEEVK